MKKFLFVAAVLLNMCWFNQAMARCSPSADCRTCNTPAETNACEKAKAEIEYLNAKKKALENCHCNCNEHSHTR